MLARTPIQSGSPRSGEDGGRLLAGSVAAVFVMLSIIVRLEASTAAVRPGVEASRQSSEIVDRGRKGDRLVLAQAVGLNAAKRLCEIRLPRAPAANSKLPNGCESLVSPLAHRGLAKVPGRCVS